MTNAQNTEKLFNTLIITSFVVGFIVLGYVAAVYILNKYKEINAPLEGNELAKPKVGKKGGKYVDPSEIADKTADSGDVTTLDDLLDED